MTVGERIKHAREQLGLSQDELALKMGYTTRQAVSKAERHGDNITTTKVKKYADALGVSFAYLMGWEQNSDHSTRTLESKIEMNKRNGGSSIFVEKLYRDTIGHDYNEKEVSNKKQVSIDFLPEEIELIHKYRNASPEVKDMIVRLLAFAVEQENKKS